MKQEHKHMAIGAVVVIVLVVVGILGFAWYRIRQDLSQAPPRTSAALAPNVPTSVIAFPVTLAFNGLAARLESAAPKTFAGSGKGPDVCAKNTKLCSGTQYDYSAKRGAITLGEGPGGTLRLTVPLAVSGHISLHQNGAKIPARSFEASTDALADASLDMSQDWCPRLKLNTDLSNLNVKVQITRGSDVDLAPQIKDGVQKTMARLESQLGGVLKCDDVRAKVREVWVTRSFPLPLPGDPRPLYVNADPVSFGFSGVKLTQADVSFMLSLGVQVSVADKALPVEPKPLPPWTPVALGKGGVQLAIPLRISYDGLDSHLLALLAAHPLNVDTFRGKGKIVVDHLNIYPSGDRLAVGAHISATMPDSFFDTGGWVYWTAKPQLDAGGKAVQLAGVGYSKLSSSPLAKMLTDVLDTQMHKGLAAAGQFDLTDSLEKTAAQLQKGLGGGKLAFDLAHPRIKLGRIVLGEDALFVEALFSAGGDTAPPPAAPGA